MLVKTIKTALSAVFLGPLPCLGAPRVTPWEPSRRHPSIGVCLRHIGGPYASTCLVARKSVEIRKKIALSPERKEHEALTSHISQVGGPVICHSKSQEGHCAQGHKHAGSHLDGQARRPHPGSGGAASAQAVLSWAQSQRGSDIRTRQMAGVGGGAETPPESAGSNSCWRHGIRATGKQIRAIGWRASSPQLSAGPAPWPPRPSMGSHRDAHWPRPRGPPTPSPRSQQGVHRLLGKLSF